MHTGMPLSAHPEGMHERTASTSRGMHTGMPLSAHPEGMHERTASFQKGMHTGMPLSAQSEGMHERTASTQRGLDLVAQSCAQQVQCSAQHAQRGQHQAQRTVASGRPPAPFPHPAFPRALPLFSAVAHAAPQRERGADVCCACSSPDAFACPPAPPRTRRDALHNADMPLPLTPPPCTRGGWCALHNADMSLPPPHPRAREGDGAPC
eukprot:365767-Chlamydomonas_euryale.AAC.6